MNREEALAYLSVDSEEEAEDAYEMRLFEIKQQLLTKPILWKTAEAKIRRLNQLHQAFETLTQVRSSSIFSESTIQLSGDLEERLSSYHRLKSQLKQQLSQSSDALSVIHYLHQLIELEREFTIPFNLFSDWCEESVAIGVEPDAMQFLNHIRKQSELGRRSVEILFENKNSLPMELLLALKRLSLLKNYLYP